MDEDFDLGLPILDDNFEQDTENNIPLLREDDEPVEENEQPVSKSQKQQERPDTKDETKIDKKDNLNDKDKDSTKKDLKDKLTKAKELEEEDKDLEAFDQENALIALRQAIKHNSENERNNAVYEWAISNRQNTDKFDDNARKEIFFIMKDTDYFSTNPSPKITPATQLKGCDATTCKKVLSKDIMSFMFSGKSLNEIDNSNLESIRSLDPLAESAKDTSNDNISKTETSKETSEKSTNEKIR